MALACRAVLNRPNVAAPEPKPRAITFVTASTCQARIKATIISKQHSFSLMLCRRALSWQQCYNGSSAQKLPSIKGTQQPTTGCEGHAMHQIGAHAHVNGCYHKHTPATNDCKAHAVSSNVRSSLDDSSSPQTHCIVTIGPRTHASTAILRRKTIEPLIV